MNYATLSRMLRAWKVDAQLPPRFQEDLWRRIECAKAPTAASVWQTLAAWLDAAFRRPAMVVSFAVVLLAAGAAAGRSQARQETARLSGELSVRYVHSIDPYKPNL